MPPIEHSPNGRPGLVDQYGKPLRKGEEGRASGIAIPHVLTFVGRLSGASRTYLHDLFDEALRHSREDAQAMRRDAYLMALLQERQLAVTGLKGHLEVPDKRDPAQAAVLDCLSRAVGGMHNFRRMLQWWAEAVWYGKYGVQMEYEWREPLAAAGGGGKYRPRRVLTVADAWPVNGDKIGHHEDHTPYVLINAGAASDGRFARAEVVYTTRGAALTLRGAWRERFVIHKHLQEDADFFAPEQAEAVHGVGIRSKLFWTNFLKMQWLGNITSFFDRVGLGVTVWTYPAGNDEALLAVKAAAAAQSDHTNVFVPVDPDDDRRKGTGIERMEVPTTGADALGKLIDMLDRHVERYVVGQEASSASAGGGLGDSGKNLQADTKRNIQVMDAALLAQTITGSDREPGLISVMKKYTFPWADFPVTWAFDVENVESEAKLRSAKALVDMGLPIKADEARAAAGFSKPIDGDELVEPQPQGQPGGPGAPGNPAAGAPGEQAQGGGGDEGGADAQGGDDGGMGDLLAGLMGGAPEEGGTPDGDA